jgi:RNA polymerase sigma factor (sigma-70 family)
MSNESGKISGDTRGNRVPGVHQPPAAVLRKLSDQDRDRLRRILSEPVEFLEHESFRQAQTGRALFGDAEASARPWCNSAEGLANAGGGLTRGTALSASQEQRLFLRLNYARYRMSCVLEACRHKRLTLKAAQELLWWHAQVEAGRAEIIQANLPLVLAMAKRTRLGNIDYAELISEGNMALLRSVDKFDCSRGFKFSTYACRAILKSFSRVAMRTSRYRGRFPTEFDPSLEKSDYQEQQRTDVEFDCVEELRTILSKNSADLNEVEVKVIQARFAISQAVAGEPEAPKTLEQVGLMIGVTKERVRQIQNRALAKLREKLENDFLAA